MAEKRLSFFTDVSGKLFKRSRTENMLSSPCAENILCSFPIVTSLKSLNLQKQKCKGDSISDFNPETAIKQWMVSYIVIV
jgi:hypothetical protein